MPINRNNCSKIRIVSCIKPHQDSSSFWDLWSSEDSFDRLCTPLFGGVLGETKACFVGRREGRRTMLIWGQGNLFLCGLNIMLKHLNPTGSKGPFVIKKNFWTIYGLWSFNIKKVSMTFLNCCDFWALSRQTGKAFLADCCTELF